jgi:hypothetical protein
MPMFQFYGRDRVSGQIRSMGGVTADTPQKAIASLIGMDENTDLLISTFTDIDIAAGQATVAIKKVNVAVTFSDPST